MRMILIATVVPAAMLVACAKPAEEAADANATTEEVVAPSETMDANATDMNAMDANAVEATDQGSTDQRPAETAVDGSTDQER